MNVNRKQRIYQLLSQQFQVQILSVEDESLQHKNHLPEHHGKETHYFVRISCRDLDSLGKVEQHRKVYAALQPEFESGLHALRIEVLP